MRRRTVLSVLGVALSLVTACSSGGGGGSGGSGGAGRGGHAGGGATGSGGTTSSGGSTATGGASATGGVSGSGGTTGAGGSAGAPASTGGRGGGAAGSGGSAAGAGGNASGGIGGTGGHGGGAGGGGRSGTGGGGAGGSAGTGGGHVCAAICNSCATGPCCGSACCGRGEWCDISGATPVCRCGGGDACSGGNTCNAPTVDPANPCGVVCCSGSSCPVSRRVFKRDIHELDRDELARVYGELRDIKLTTYQYKAEPAGARRRLGFIIDDTRSAYPINADGTSVDLYGYVSMAVAAIQTQSREIAALRAEVARLEAQRSARSSRAPR